MANISYDAGKTANVINELNNAKSQLSGTTQALQSAVNIILNARGIEQVDTAMLPGIIEMPNKCQEKISEQANQISSSAEKVEAYNADVNGANGLIRMFASKFMFHTFLIEGVLTAGEQIVDGAASAVGWIAGLWDKNTEENIAKWIRKDHVGDFFAEQYGEGGSLYDMNKYSYISANGTAANLIKVAGIATGYALTVAAGGAALGAVSGAVAGTGAVAGAASGASLASSSVFAQAAVAGLGGLGSGTQTGLRQQNENNLNFNEALKQGVKQGAIQAGTVFAVNAALPYISKGVSALKGTFGGKTTSTALTVVDDATSATGSVFDDAASAVGSTGDDIVNATTNSTDDIIENMTQKYRSGEISADEFRTWGKEQFQNLNGELSKAEVIKYHPDKIDGIIADVNEELAGGNIANSNVASETINTTTENIVNNATKTTPIPNTTTGNTISSEVSGVADDVVSGLPATTNTGLPSGISGASSEVISGLPAAANTGLPSGISGASSEVISGLPAAANTGLPSGVSGTSSEAISGLPNVNQASNAIGESSPVPSTLINPSSTEVTTQIPTNTNITETTPTDIATQTPTNTNIAETVPTESPSIPTEPATPVSTEPTTPVSTEPTTPTTPEGSPAITVALPPDDPTPPVTDLNISEPSTQPDVTPTDTTPTNYPETTPTGGTSLTCSTPSSSTGTTPISDNSTSGITDSQPSSTLSDTITNTPETVQEPISEPETISDSPNSTPDITSEPSYQSEPETISDSPYPNTTEQTPYQENINTVTPNLNEYEAIPNTNVNEYEEIPNTNVNANTNNLSDYFTAGIIGAVGGATSAIVGSNIKKKKENKDEEEEEERIEEI